MSDTKQGAKPPASHCHRPRLMWRIGATFCPLARLRRAVVVRSVSARFYFAVTSYTVLEPFSSAKRRICDFVTHNPPSSSHPPHPLGTRHTTHNQPHAPTCLARQAVRQNHFLSMFSRLLPRPLRRRKAEIKR